MGLMLVRCGGCKTGCSLVWFRECEDAARGRISPAPRTPSEVCAVWLAMGEVIRDVDAA